MPGTVTIGSTLVIGDDPAATGRAAARGAREQIDGTPDLAVVFISPTLGSEPRRLLDAIHDELAPRHLVGCTGETVIGTGREVEDRPAVVVWAARLPGARLRGFRAMAHVDGDGGVTFPGWPGEGPDAAPPAPDAVRLVLADPYSFPVDGLLARARNRRGGPPLVGGLASGGRGPGGHLLFLDDSWLVEGAVGVEVSGTPVSVGVSQGCAPVGPEMVVTDADEGGVVYELAGRPAITKLNEVVEGLGPRERRLALDGLLAGLVIDENRPEHARGDFLVRGILGADRETGALVLGERVRVGQTVRLHVRDASSADEDLRDTARATRRELGADPRGILLFSCNGRGTHMFPMPDHDASIVAQELDNAPTAGLFCNGEIGPVGGRPFVHGFTATMAVFGDAAPALTHHADAAP